MAESIDEKPLPSFERTGIFDGGDGPLWITTIRRELRENGNPITDISMFSAMNPLLGQGVREILLSQAGIEAILAKSNNGKEITHTEFMHLTKTISTLFPAKSAPPPGSPQLEKSPQEQLLELHQYKYESRAEYFQRAVELRDTLSFSAHWTSETLVVNFIDGLLDPVLASLVLEKRDRDPAQIINLEDADFWIEEAKKLVDFKSKAITWATAGMNAHEKKFRQMWYGKKEKGAGNAKYFGSREKFFKYLKRRTTGVRDSEL